MFNEIISSLPDALADYTSDTSKGNKIDKLNQIQTVLLKVYPKFLRINTNG